MAPDRGDPVADSDAISSALLPTESSRTRPDIASIRRQSSHLDHPDDYATASNFTLRGILAGLVIGVVINFSNMYFGLQTGWVSGMAMPSALLGFASFRALARHIRLPFSPQENVLVQSVAGSVGVMPLGCGFVGVMPALEYLLKPEEGGPLKLSLWKLMVWSVGICFFGVIFAVPLRREVIVREKLKFPSGTATALMIAVLHNKPGALRREEVDCGEPCDDGKEEDADGETQPLLISRERSDSTRQLGSSAEEGQESANGATFDWKANIRLLVLSFALSASFTLFSYFVPQVRSIPFLGTNLATNWLWKLNPSPAYVGQGIIMGPTTTTHLLIGAIFGWGILSPIAKYNGWAPGDVDDWTNGSKGWIVWISLAIMLADSLVSLGWLILRPLWYYGPTWVSQLWHCISHRCWKDIATLQFLRKPCCVPLMNDNNTDAHNGEPLTLTKSMISIAQDEAADDAPPEHQISLRTTAIGLVLSIGLAILTVHITFPSLIPLSLTLLAMALALLLSIMGVRALGETDLNPVSGISKLTQLIFALVTPRNGTSNNNNVIINLVAGALSESGALQAGDLLQDLKTGHLLHASPAAQFYGQLIGCTAGGLLAALVYRLYTSVYPVPGPLFQVPTAYVWIFTARLVLGDGFPPRAATFAAATGALWVALTILRVVARERRARAGGCDAATGASTRGQRLEWWWRNAETLVPGGIAVAVGMYNAPSFTLPRAIGGFVSLWWKRRRRGGQEAPIVVLASGLILGEGLFSILNLVLESAGVRHL